MANLKAKTVIGFINTTLKGNSLVFGSTSEEKAKRIINAILLFEDIKIHKEVKEYCKKHYNY